MTVCIHRVPTSERCSECVDRTTALLGRPVVETPEDLVPPPSVEPDPPDELARDHVTRCGFHRFNQRHGEEQCLLHRGHLEVHFYLSDSHKVSNPFAGRGAAGSPPTPGGGVMGHEAPAQGVALGDGGGTQPLTSEVELLRARVAELETAAGKSFGDAEVAQLRTELQRAQVAAATDRKERHDAIWALAGFVQESCDGHNWQGLIRCAEWQRSELERKLRDAEQQLERQRLVGPYLGDDRELVEVELERRGSIACGAAFDFARLGQMALDALPWAEVCEVNAFEAIEALAVDNALRDFDWRLQLSKYIDEAKAALGDQQITGQPLAEAIAMLRQALRLAEAQRDDAARQLRDARNDLRHMTAGRDTYEDRTRLAEHLLCALAFDFVRAVDAVRPLVAKEWVGNQVLALLQRALPEVES